MNMNLAEGHLPESLPGLRELFSDILPSFRSAHDHNTPLDHRSSEWSHQITPLRTPLGTPGYGYITPSHGPSWRESDRSHPSPSSLYSHQHLPDASFLGSTLVDSAASYHQQPQPVAMLVPFHDLQHLPSGPVYECPDTRTYGSQRPSPSFRPAPVTHLASNTSSSSLDSVAILVKADSRGGMDVNTSLLSPSSSSITAASPVQYYGDLQMSVQHNPMAKQFEVKVENIENKAVPVAVHDYDDTSSFDTHIDSTVGPTRTAATSAKSPKLVRSSQSTKPFACPRCKKRFMLESRLGAHFRSYPGHMPLQANDDLDACSSGSASERPDARSSVSSEAQPRRRSPCQLRMEQAPMEAVYESDIHQYRSEISPVSGFATEPKVQSSPSPLLSGSALERRPTWEAAEAATALAVLRTSRSTSTSKRIPPPLSIVLPERVSLGVSEVSRPALGSGPLAATPVVGAGLRGTQGMKLDTLLLAAMG